MITHFQSIQGLSNTTALSGDLQLHLWVQHRSPPGAHKGSLVGALPACSARQGPLLLAGRSWLRCQLYLAGRLTRLSKGQSLRTTELTCKGGTDKATRRKQCVPRRQGRGLHSRCFVHQEPRSGLRQGHRSAMLSHFPIFLDPLVAASHVAVPGAFKQHKHTCADIPEHGGAVL